MRFLDWLLVATLLALHAVVLFCMGQPWIYEGGYVKIWYGAAALTAENSQHLFDWYSPSHVIHGFLFYAALTFFFPRLSVGTRLLMALIIESGWELFENTDLVINRYREQALAQGYFGDSIVNSMGDMIAAAFGFFCGSRFALWFSIAAIVGLECLALYVIRDSLILNIIQLIHPVDAIGAWQAGS